MKNTIFVDWKKNAGIRFKEVEKNGENGWIK
jgi:hypothetical protein